MTNYFLGSVGVAKAFYVHRGYKKLAFVARTLTEHSININAQTDELRAGTGAVNYATFTHDPKVEIKLVDVLWDSAYVEGILGTKFKTQDGVAGANDYVWETVVSVGPNVGTELSHVPVSLPFGTFTQNPGSRLTVTLSFPLGAVETKIMINAVGTDQWIWYEGLINENRIFLPAGSWNVMYMATEESARELWLTTELCPSELYLIITTPLYKSGCRAVNADDSSYEVGHITLEVPRFKLNGSLDLSMAMSSNTSIELSGQALASDLCPCDTMKMMRIVEVRDDYDFTDEIQSISLVGEG